MAQSQETSSSFDFGEKWSRDKNSQIERVAVEKKDSMPALFSSISSPIHKNKLKSKSALNLNKGPTPSIVVTQSNALKVNKIQIKRDIHPTLKKGRILSPIPKKATKETHI
jgi:hypothetical protein